MMNTDEFVGQRLLRMNIGWSLNPAVEAVVPAETDVDAFTKQLTEKIIRLVDSELVAIGSQEHEWTSVGSMEHGAHVYHSHIILTREEQKAEWNKQDERLCEIFSGAHKERIARMGADPNNGKLGWWRAVGIRNEYTVKAASALEAVEKAFGEESWESPEATWIGEELPDVV